MGLRYRKSVKILPGVRVNISKSGLSTTIGPKGTSVNIGKKGVYANAGIPGTGVFMREKISGTKTNSQTKSSNKGSDPEFIRLFEAYEPISLKIDNTGKVVVLGKDNMVITDAFFLKILKTMDAYKTEKEQLVAAWKEKSEEVYQKARESISELINIHQYSFDVKPEEAYAQELAKIKKQEYQKQLFDGKEPTKQQVEASLASYADVHITTKAFWRVKKLRRQYVQENLEQQYQKQHSEWEKRKAEFDNKQQIIADSLNDSYEKEYMEKCETIKAAISGSEEYVKEHIEKWLANCSFPVEINVDYEYEVKTGDVYIDILLPTEEVIPTQEMIRLANGGVKEKAKPKTKMQEEYARLIIGLGICITSGVFDISPAIKRILISGFVPSSEEREDAEDICLYSVKYDRSSFENTCLQEINPLEFISGFDNRIKASQTWLMKPVSPFEDF